MRSPDSSTLIGIGGATAALLLGFIVEGGSPLGLVSISSIIIILGGTIGALITSFGIKDVLRIIILLKESMTSSAGPTKTLITELISFAEKARREGLLALENDIEHIDTKFLQKGIRMVVDGVDPEVVRNTLENDITIYEATKKEDAGIFDAAGGFSPTMGIIGTVMGLILVLSNLGGNASELGHSIAAAFIATFYGIGLANIFWLPVGNKLKKKVKKDVLEMECIMTGLQSLQAGDNPALMKERLKSYLGEDAELDETPAQ